MFLTEVVFPVLLDMRNPSFLTSPKKRKLLVLLTNPRISKKMIFNKQVDTFYHYKEVFNITVILKTDMENRTFFP